MIATMKIINVNTNGRRRSMLDNHPAKQPDGEAKAMVKDMIKALIREQGVFTGHYKGAGHCSRKDINNDKRYIADRRQYQKHGAPGIQYQADPHRYPEFHRFQAVLYSKHKN